MIDYPNPRLKGRPIQVYCDLCNWSGQVIIPVSYTIPTCSPMAQSCPHCGNCYLHLMPRRSEADVLSYPEHVKDLHDDED